MTRSRKQCRGGHQCDPRTWSEALYCLVHHSDLEPAEIAARIGKRVGYLLDAANPDREETKFQADLLTAVMHVTGNLAPLRYLCGEFGGVFVALATGPASEDAVLCAFTQAVTEMGQSGAALTRSFADAVLTREESAWASRELDETVAACLHVKALVQSRVGGTL